MKAIRDSDRCRSGSEPSDTGLFIFSEVIHLALQDTTYVALAADGQQLLVRTDVPAAAD